MCVCLQMAINFFKYFYFKWSRTIILSKSVSTSIYVYVCIYTQV